MRALIATVDYPPIEGGIGSLSLQLARELSREGHEVTVVAPYFPDMEDFDAAEPYTVVRFRGYHWGLLRIVPFLFAAWRRARKTDALFAMDNTYGGMLGWTMRLLFRTPYVTFAYAYEFMKYARRPIMRRVLRAIYKRSNKVIAISNYTRDTLLRFGVDEARIVVVFPGAPEKCEVSLQHIDELRHLLVLDEGPIILAVGRMIERKGQVRLVRAMPRILKSEPKAQLVLVGRGPEMSAILRAAYRLGVREHVCVPGPLPDEDVAALHAMSDVFALPVGESGNGQVEGFGLVFVEAQAHGTPVVAGRSGGVGDAVLDGETGLLVEPDDIEGLADAIVRLIQDKELAGRLRDAALHRVRAQLNWRVFTHRVLEAAFPPEKGPR